MIKPRRVFACATTMTFLPSRMSGTISDSQYPNTFFVFPELRPQTHKPNIIERRWQRRNKGGGGGGGGGGGKRESSSQDTFSKSLIKGGFGRPHVTRRPAAANSIISKKYKTKTPFSTPVVAKGFFVDTIMPRKDQQKKQSTYENNNKMRQSMTLQNETKRNETQRAGWSSFPA